MLSPTHTHIIHGSNFLQVGFMYCINHGVPETQCEAMLDATRRFFDTSSSVKASVDARRSEHYRGYNSFEYGAHSCTPEDKVRAEASMSQTCLYSCSMCCRTYTKLTLSLSTGRTSDP
jgi:hypothetical protein